MFSKPFLAFFGVTGLLDGIPCSPPPLAPFRYTSGLDRQTAGHDEFFFLLMPVML